MQLSPLSPDGVISAASGGLVTRNDNPQTDPHQLKAEYRDQLTQQLMKGIQANQGYHYDGLGRALLGNLTNLFTGWFADDLGGQIFGSSNQTVISPMEVLSFLEEQKNNKVERKMLQDDLELRRAMLAQQAEQADLEREFRMKFLEQQNAHDADQADKERASKAELLQTQINGELAKLGKGHELELEMVQALAAVEEGKATAEQRRWAARFFVQSQYETARAVWEDQRGTAAREDTQNFAREQLERQQAQQRLISTIQSATELGKSAIYAGTQILTAGMKEAGQDRRSEDRNETERDIAGVKQAAAQQEALDEQAEQVETFEAFTSDIFSRVTNTLGAERGDRIDEFENEYNDIPAGEFDPAQPNEHVKKFMDRVRERNASKVFQHYESDPYGTSAEAVSKLMMDDVDSQWKQYSTALGTAFTDYEREHTPDAADPYWGYKKQIKGILENARKAEEYAINQEVEDGHTKFRIHRVTENMMDTAIENGRVDDPVVSGLRGDRPSHGDSVEKWRNYGIAVGQYITPELNRWDKLSIDTQRESGFFGDLFPMIREGRQAAARNYQARHGTDMDFMRSLQRAAGSR